MSSNEVQRKQLSASEVTQLLEEGDNLEDLQPRDVMDVLESRQGPLHSKVDEFLDWASLDSEGEVADLSEAAGHWLKYTGAGALAGLVAAGSGQPELREPLIYAGMYSAVGVEAAEFVNRKISRPPGDTGEVARSLYYLAKESTDVDVRGLEEPYETTLGVPKVRTYIRKDGDAEDLHYIVEDPVAEVAVSGTVDDYEGDLPEEYVKNQIEFV
jgi:hypothetical protein